MKEPISMHVLDYRNTIVKPIQALGRFGTRSFVLRENECSGISVHSQSIRAILFQVVEDEDGAGAPLRQFFTDIPQNLRTGTICRLIWRDTCVAFSLHQGPLSAASLFLQELTAVMAIVKRNRLYSSAIIVREEVQQNTVITDSMDFSCLLMENQ